MENKFFSNKAKATVWILLSLSIFIYLFIAFEPDFFKGPIFETIAALIGIFLICGMVGFLGLLIIDTISSWFFVSSEIEHDPISKEDRKKFKKEIKEIAPKIRKKNDQIAKAFQGKKEYSAKEVRSIISGKLKGSNSPLSTPSLGYHFEFKDIKHFHFSLGFINGFNFGCYGRDDFHGIDFEYFSEVNFYRVSLDSKAKNIKEEERTTKLLGQETLDIMREQVDPNSFKIVTTIKARLLYEEMISDKYIKEKIFDGLYTK